MSLNKHIDNTIANNEIYAIQIVIKKFLYFVNREKKSIPNIDSWKNLKNNGTLIEEFIKKNNNHFSKSEQCLLADLQKNNDTFINEELLNPFLISINNTIDIYDVLIRIQSQRKHKLINPVFDQKIQEHIFLVQKSLRSIDNTIFRNLYGVHQSDENKLIHKDANIFELANQLIQGIGVEIIDRNFISRNDKLLRTSKAFSTNKYPVIALAFMLQCLDIIKNTQTKEIIQHILENEKEVIYDKFQSSKDIIQKLKASKDPHKTSSCCMEKY